MEWYPKKTEQRLSIEWLNIPPVVRAHYDSLETYCAWRENSGVIKNARNFSKRDWDRIASIPKNVISRMEAAHLIHWEGENLVLHGYDVEQQDKIQQRKKQQSKAGSTKKTKKSEAKQAESNENDGTNTETTQETVDKTADRLEEREEKKEKKENSVAGATTDLFGKDPPPKKRKKKPPLPYTIAQVAKTLAEHSGGMFNPDMPDSRLAKPVTSVIRELGDEGVTLDDIAAAGRWIAGGGTGGHEVGMLWLAGIGKLGNAVAQGRKAKAERPASAAPVIVSGDGEIITTSYGG